MLRKLGLVIVAALVTSPAFAAVTFDFNDGLQGWTIVNSGAINIGRWVAPGEVVQLATDTMGDPINSSAGGGNVYLPGDGNGRTTAVLDLAPYLVGGKTRSFTLQADVWIPNLRPLNFRYNYPGMLNQYSGVSAYGKNGTTNSDYGVTLGGNLVQGSQMFRDYTSENWTKHEKGWIMEDSAAAPSYDTMWNQWIKLKIDWNQSSPGNVIASAYIPWTAPVAGPPGWVTIWSGAIEPSTWYPRPLEVNRIGIGCWLKGDTPWTKSQIDNVVFDSPDLIPEPASLMLLGLGSLALLRRRA